MTPPPRCCRRCQRVLPADRFSHPQSRVCDECVKPASTHRECRVCRQARPVGEFATRQSRTCLRCLSGKAERRRKRQEVRRRRNPPPPRLLPAGPLVAVIRRRERLLSGLGSTRPRGDISELVGVPERTINAWESGERQHVQLDTADLVLIRLGLNPWDVWDPVEFPRVAEVLGYA